MAKTFKRTEEDAYAALQQSPILCVEVMWGLTPQPLKAEFKQEAQEAIEDCNWKAFRKRWFQPFKKGEHMTWQQWVILLALEAGIQGRAPKRISVRSGHGIGKDCTLAWIILWFLFCHVDAQVPCTAPTAPQLDDILWKEITKWHHRMPEEIAAKYDIKSEYIRMVERPKTWFARARTARKEQPEALAGTHGEWVLYVSDEASGVPDEIYRTAEGAMTGQNPFFIMISNPTRLDGYFYESHNENKEQWQCLAFNGEDSPMVDREYVERIENQHGRDSDEFRKRVLGDFPQKDIEMDGWIPILSKEEIDLALMSEGVKHAGTKAMGGDVAEGTGGDESVITQRSMNLAEVLFASNSIDNMEMAGEIIINQDEEGIQPENTAIDKIGVGNGTYRRLLEQKRNVQGINVSEEAEDSKMFVNKKAEGYWRFRSWVKNGGKLKSSKDADGKERWYQLTQVRYKTADSSGKIMIMPKDMMRRKGIGSPDAAESCMLTFLIKITHDDKGFTKEDVFFMRKMLQKKKKK